MQKREIFLSSVYMDTCAFSVSIKKSCNFKIFVRFMTYSDCRWFENEMYVV